MSDSIRKQVLEMYVGVVLHNLVLAAICLVRFRSVPVFLGLLAGMLGAFGLLASIAVSAELCAASGDEAYASKKWRPTRFSEGWASLRLWLFYGSSRISIFLRRHWDFWE